MRDNNERPGDARSGNNALDDLRAYANALADAIARHPYPSLEQEEARWRLDELVEELARNPPSGPRVKSRWIRLVPLLTTLRPDLPIPWMGELIERAV